MHGGSLSTTQRHVTRSLSPLAHCSHVIWPEIEFTQARKSCQEWHCNDIAGAAESLWQSSQSSETQGPLYLARVLNSEIAQNANCLRQTVMIFPFSNDLDRKWSA